MITRRRFIGGCIAGVALAPLASMGAQVDGLKFAKFHGGGDAWVDPHYELALEASFNGVHLCGGTYKDASRSAFLQGIEGTITPAATGRWLLRFTVKHKETGETARFDVPDIGPNLERTCLVRAGSGVAAEMKLSVRISTLPEGASALYIATTATRFS